MTWKTEYSKEQDGVKIEGFSATEEDCRQYFTEFVLPKLKKADTAEQLRLHLQELVKTGFDSSGLLACLEPDECHKFSELGEIIAESVLETEHEVMFPWETNWDKRNKISSLAGADIVGFQNKVSARFIFGEVKSSSEDRVPPQIVNQSKGCLKEQMHNLCHNEPSRYQLIQWLYVRVKETEWIDKFNEALTNYANKNYCLIGILVSGGRILNDKDLTGICKDIKKKLNEAEISLFGYYLPFKTKEWNSLINDLEAKK